MSKLYEFIVEFQDKFSATVGKLEASTAKVEDQYNKLQVKGMGALDAVMKGHDRAMEMTDKHDLSINGLTKRIDDLKKRRDVLPDSRKGREQIRAINEEIRITEKRLNHLQNLPPGGFFARLGRVTSMLSGIGGLFAGAFATARIVSFGKDSVAMWDKQEKAVAQVRQGLVSTGGAAGFTLDQLTNKASELQSKTIFGDESILNDVTAQFLTFNKIQGDVFDRGQGLALDLATRLGGDLKGASIQLGKALQDPISGITALSRSGVTFSEEQKKVIKALTESGRLAEAQTVILDELEQQYGGSAQAAAEAGSGGWQNIANTFGDVQEKIGGLINEALNPLQPIVRKIAVGLDGFFTKIQSGIDQLRDPQSELRGMFEEVMEWIEAIGIAIAVAGGIVAGWGVVWSILNAKMLASIALTQIMAAKTWLLNTAFWANPITWVVAGIIALVAAIAIAYQKSEKFRGLLWGLWEAFKSVFENIRELGGNVLGGIGDMLIGVFTFDIDKMKGGLDKLKNGFSDFGTKVADSFKQGYADGVADFHEGGSSSLLDKLLPPKPTSGSAADFLSTDDNAGGLNLGADIAKGNDSIIGGGSKQTNINVQFEQLIKDLNIYAESVEGGINDMEDKVKQALLRILNSINLMAR